MKKNIITSKKLPANLATYMTLFLIIGAASIGIGCVDKETQAVSESILVKGSDTVLPLAQAESETFMMANTDKSVTVIGGGSGVGIAALIDGEVDIAMASREMKPSEIENARSNGIDPVEHTVCWDGIAVAVNPENTVSTLTLSQVRGIYNGSITNWEEVGGTDLKIVAISRDSSSGTYEYFKENVLEGEEYRPDALIQSATGAIVLEVSQNKNAVGYIGIAYLDESVKAISLNSDGTYVLPSAETVKTGAYPLARPLYFYTNGEPTGLAKTFLDYVLGPDGQGIVSEIGYIPV
ncbi:MAG: PstS family phosphate ABC transporter substrate-binding protein [Methanosarcinaceae archaeon]|nr:PstS family phosphate ABC transporter substrate-binding protein [Methanosarcinaceae archaeon]